MHAVKRYLEGTEGGKTIANSIGVHPRELYQWIKRFEFSGEKAFKKRYTTFNEYPGIKMSCSIKKISFI
ncbi:helix-turn-helix domain-containing protein [Bacillus thuringiensis]|uniref:helix-turn-helix domain-containing protein n=1 Tax=Bacillus thuringiensis TaxID=1428 RepID=UPI001FB5E977|nr:helix-turn-helix domain-containing protein [Bacillus thuringiensis]